EEAPQPALPRGRKEAAGKVPLAARRNEHGRRDTESRAKMAARPRRPRSAKSEELLNDLVEHVRLRREATPGTAQPSDRNREAGSRARGGGHPDAVRIARTPASLARRHCPIRGVVGLRGPPPGRSAEAGVA